MITLATTGADVVLILEIGLAFALVVAFLFRHRVLCMFGIHSWRSPAMTHGSDIPTEFTPREGDSPEDVVRLFRDYTTLRCRHCPKRHTI